MGQKVNPNVFRFIINRNWTSRWYSANYNFSLKLRDDLIVREYLKKKLAHASVGCIIIERKIKNSCITIFSSRPGIVIGKKGEDVEKLKSKVEKYFDSPLYINIEEIRKPELDAKLIADSIKNQLERRLMFRRVMKRSIQNAMRFGAKGVKIMSSGRLNGIEIARTEWYKEGRVPLHSLCANIDYATSKSKTTYGIIGIKVWIYKGDIDDESSDNIDDIKRKNFRYLKFNERRSNYNNFNKNVKKVNDVNLVKNDGNNK